MAANWIDLVDDIEAGIDELEDQVEMQRPEIARNRISQLGHDLLQIERTLARVVHDVEVARALDRLELARDHLASVRDFHESKTVNDRNVMTKRLTVIASVLLVPTLIVGIYGRSEMRWQAGYAFWLTFIAATTLVQLWFFERKRWL
jgi:Mg2+ and Co2+ transporter CorA